MQRITIVRRVVQFGAFILTGKLLAIGWLRCPYAVPFVSCPGCPLADCPGKYLFFPALIVIGLVSIVSGRGFCGWLCPMGLVEDALGHLEKPKKWLRNVWTTIDPVLKWLKWPALILVIWAVFAYNYQTFNRPYEYVVRSPNVFNLQSYELAWMLEGGSYKIRFGILLTALVGALVVSRFWCRYLCPLGALLAAFNRFSILKLHKAENACRHCEQYPRDCSMHTCPDTVECVICGECVEGCPNKAINLRARMSSPKQPEEEEAAVAKASNE